MLTKVRAYSAWQSAPTLFLSEDGRADTDLIQIRNIDGLDPVVGDEGRNIVLTLHPNPDWNTWSPEALRKILYSYFMPNQLVRLVFDNDDADMPSVDIRGYVESFAANPFSSDPEFLASVICPDPDFYGIEPIVVTGTDGNEVDIVYNGHVETGIQVRVDYVSGPAPDKLTIQIDNPTRSFFRVNKASVVSSTKSFRMSSLLMNKYAENINDTNTSLLSDIATGEGSEWITLRPGLNKFTVITDTGVQSWELTYFERFGGL